MHFNQTEQYHTITGALQHYSYTSLNPILTPHIRYPYIRHICNTGELLNILGSVWTDPPNGQTIDTMRLIETTIGKRNRWLHWCNAFFWYESHY